MPNWCSNSLSITGPEAELKKVLKAAVVTREKGGAEELNCQGLIPVPKALLSNDWQGNAEISEKNQKKYGYAGWYDFCISEWGTKWTPEIGTIEQSGSYTIISFDSAWSPPIPVISKLASMFPKCNFMFSYCEPGCDFAGEASWEKGELIEENTYSISDEEGKIIAARFGFDDFGGANDEEGEETPGEEVVDNTDALDFAAKVIVENIIEMKEAKEKTDKTDKPAKPTSEQLSKFEQDYIQR